jgi:hypothetical protein
MDANGEGPRLTIDLNTGSLKNLQAMEDIVGVPADKWKDVGRARVLIAALQVYGGLSQEEAEEMSPAEAMKRIRLDDTETP